jgi:hypothetical protein
MSSPWRWGWAGSGTETAIRPQRNLALARPNEDQSLPHIGLAGDTYTILLTGKKAAGRYCLIAMLVPPGGGPPPHRHDFEEMFTVLFRADGREVLSRSVRAKQSFARKGVPKQSLGTRAYKSANNSLMSICWSCG